MPVAAPVMRTVDMGDRSCRAVRLRAGCRRGLPVGGGACRLGAGLVSLGQALSVGGVLRRLERGDQAMPQLANRTWPLIHLPPGPAMSSGVPSRSSGEAA